MMIKNNILIIIFLSGINLTWAQSESSALDTQSPTFHTPDVSILKKIQDISVNHYTGVPSISIPLYQVTGKQVTIPISADYFAGGILVSQESGILGLGWSLNTGGVISREIRGSEDEKAGGYLEIVNNLPPSSTIEPMLYKSIPSSVTDTPEDLFYSGLADQNTPLLLKDRMGNYTNFSNYYTSENWTPDLQSDLYTLSFPGFSGKFVFDNDGKVQFLKHTGINVEWEYVDTSSRKIKWTITDQKGTKYYYNLDSKSHIDISNSNPKLGGDSKVQVSSWELTEVEAPSGATIVFNYELEQLENIPRKSESILHSETAPSDFSCSPFGVVENTVTTTVVTGSNLLKSIVFPSGSVVFNYVNDRIDLKNASRLSNLIVKDYNGKRINKIEFNNGSYFMPDTFKKGYYDATDIRYTEDHWSKRLKLQQINLFGLNDISPQTYEFIYNAIKLPYKSSYAVDHWGYFNGQTGNNSYIPTTKYGYHQNLKKVLQSAYANHFRLQHFNGADVRTIYGANRESNNSMVASSLEKIVYPTKGYKEFTYSPNEITQNEEVVNWSKGKVRFTKDEGAASFYYEYNNQLTQTVSSNLTFSFEITRNDYAFKANYVEGGKGGSRRLKISGIWVCSSCPNSGLLPTDPDNNVIKGVVKSLDGSYRENIYWKGSVTPSGFMLGIDKELVLPLGRYTIEIFDKMQFLAGTTAYNQSRFSLGINWFRPTGTSTITQTKLFGGLRANQIKTSAPPQTIPNIKNYTYIGGKLMNKPSYKIGYRVPNYDNDTPLEVNNYHKKHHAVLKISSSTVNPNSTSAGGRVFGYNKVTEHLSGGLNGKKEYEFFNEIPSYLYSFNPNGDLSGINEYAQLSGYPIEESIKNGTLFKYQEYNSNGSVIKKEEFNYAPSSLFTTEITKKIYQQLTPSLASYMINHIGNRTSKFYYTFTYRINTEWLRLDSTIKSIDGIETTTNYKYNPNTKLLTETETTNSDGKTVSTKTIYPDDIKTATTLQDNSVIYGGALTAVEFNIVKRLQKSTPSNTRGLHQIATPVQVETTVKDTNNNLLSQSIQRTTFSEPFTNLVLPKYVQTLKGKYNDSTNKLQDRVIFQDYYSNGNVKEVLKKDGTHIIYIWGYREEYPIAKIENATYSQVSSLVSNLNSKSNADNHRSIDIINTNGTISYQGNEGLLRSALTSLRNSLPNAMVTTYTYDPLIGVTSVTDSKGYTMYYEYDTFNRLEFVKDAAGNLLSENKYNYKN